MTGYASSAQIAEYLHVDPATLRQWALRKQGPPYVLLDTGTRRYYWPDVIEWLEQRKVVHG